MREVSGAPAWEKTKAKMMIPKRIFAKGPPRSIPSLRHGLAAARPPGTSGSFSPLGRTKAPKGIQLSEKSVSRNLNNLNGARGETEPEFLHLDFASFGHQVVTRFMNDRDHAEGDNELDQGQIKMKNSS